jgi:hypothetical protein
MDRRFLLWSDENIVEAERAENDGVPSTKDQEDDDVAHNYGGRERGRGGHGGHTKVGGDMGGGT